MKVRLDKPEDCNESPIWDSNMNEFDGQIVELEELKKGTSNYYYCGYWFSPNWVTPVDVTTKEASCDCSIQKILLIGCTEHD